jgi:tetratricopeptide (TPR) repeat protein
MYIRLCVHEILYLSTYLTNLVIVNQLSKVFLYGVFLIILLVEVGCRSVNNTSVDLNASNSAAFKLRYNALYNVDKVLKEAEEGMVREEIIWLPNSLFGVPDFKYEKDVETAILKLLEILPQATDSDFKNSLYFKLGKAYYLKADYYTALEYFALSKKNLLTPEIIFWKSRALNHIGKEQLALQLLEKLSVDSLSKEDKSICVAHKAETFFKLNNLDSAIFYLEKALANNAPKKYKKYWQLKVGERLSVKNPDKAVGYLHQVPRSNTAPSELKLQAEIELISLQQLERGQQIVKLEALNKKGIR